MLALVLRRVVTALPVFIGVVFAVVLIVRLTPGDPAIILLGQAASPASVAALRSELGLDQSIVMQFVEYFGKALVGDLGRSYRSGESVVEVIASALPYTAVLTAAGLAISLLVGVPIGIISAFKQNSIWDHVLTAFALLGLSMPVFWIGTIMQWYFSFELRWLPTTGTGTWKHLVMPALSVGIYTAANFVRMLRATVIDILREDFVRTLYAKGLGKSAVLFHVLRNALVPIVTSIGLQVGLLLGGSILTETVFAWPGIGLRMVQAINDRDIVLIQGLVLTTALLFVATNLWSTSPICSSTRGRATNERGRNEETLCVEFVAGDAPRIRAPVAPFRGQSAGRRGRGDSAHHRARCAVRAPGRSGRPDRAESGAARGATWVGGAAGRGPART